MCTVSFVSSGNKIIITSNRDEQVTRPALAPQWHSVNGMDLLFPKDPRAGGTWFATDKQGNTAVLLNGAKHTHKVMPGTKYKRSRGLIVLDIISNNSPVTYWDEINLHHIEPFTLVLYSNTKLYQLRWDGILKNSLELNEKQSYIWSSSTLYTDEIIVKREKLFTDFLYENTMPIENDLYNFHTGHNQSDTENGFLINREGILKTLSITQNIIEGGTAEMKYYDDADLKNSILKSVH